MKLDILVIMAHPDDAELSCSGTIISSVKMGMKVGMIDLTKGELGTRGNEKIRIKEANNSAKLMQVQFRKNLNLIRVPLVAYTSFFCIASNNVSLLFSSAQIAASPPGLFTS